MTLDPLKPYLGAIKWGLIALLSVSLFIGGCVHGEGKSEAELARRAIQIQALTVENDQWVAANAEASKQVKANQQFAREKQKEADDAAKRIAQLEKATASKQEKNQSALDRALRNPKCSELLELQVCSAVPLP